MNTQHRNAGLGAHRSCGLGILVGPGVVQAGCGEGLRAFAARVGCGVVNTWGAKGVLRWDDPLHFGTAGLQARDFELAGLGAVDVLVTSGLDPREVTAHPWAGSAEVLDLPPDALASAAPDLPAGTLDRPPLYTELAAVVGPMYEQPGSPPWRAAALAASLPPGGLVVGEPGLAGFWLARTFPTTEPGSVCVPATGGRDAAREIARRAAAAGRSVTLVTDRSSLSPPDGVHVECWSAEEVDLDPSSLVAVAGPIVAWATG